jgi:hypothetical protein
MILALLAALAAQAPPAAPVRCLGVVVPVSGLRTAELDDEAVASLRRFARALRGVDYRIRYVVFAPYGFDRGTTSNIHTTQLRGETVRAHLVAAGLFEEHIRIVRLGEQGSYPFPPAVAEAERMMRSPSSPEHRWTTAASVTLELPPGADCSHIPRP